MIPSPEQIERLEAHLNELSEDSELAAALETLLLAVSGVHPDRSDGERRVIRRRRAAIHAYVIQPRVPSPAQREALKGWFDETFSDEYAKVIRNQMADDVLALLFPGAPK